MKQMSWSDLQTVFAVEFAYEIETVASGDAKSVIRQRLACVGTEGRQLLRSALDAVEATASV
jgi:hypothetical protein